VEEKKTTEQELLDSFVDERINMALVNLKRNKTEEENMKIFKAEQFIEHLPECDKKLIENYIDNIMCLLALEEPFLYKQGFIDGIKIMKEFMKL